MRFMMMAALVALAPAAALAQAAPGQTMTGRWTGGYLNEAEANTFDMTLAQGLGGNFSGTATEVATFGDGSAMFLTSTIRGTLAGQEVRFVKTYDGSGGVSHSVNYVGRLDRTNRRVRGTFNAEGNSGSFEMVR